MPPTYLLARDHLQRAASILEREECLKSQELHSIIVRTIDLLVEMERAAAAPVNVVDFHAFRYARARRRGAWPGGARR